MQLYHSPAEGSWVPHWPESYFLSAHGEEKDINEIKRLKVLCKWWQDTQKGISLCHQLTSPQPVLKPWDLNIFSEDRVGQGLEQLVLGDMALNCKLEKLEESTRDFKIFQENESKVSLFWCPKLNPCIVFFHYAFFMNFLKTPTWWHHHVMRSHSFPIHCTFHVQYFDFCNKF